MSMLLENYFVLARVLFLEERANPSLCMEQPGVLRILQRRKSALPLPWGEGELGQRGGKYLCLGCICRTGMHSAGKPAASGSMVPVILWEKILMKL